VVFHALKNQLICIEEELIQLQENINEKEKLLQGIADIQKYTHSMFDSISYLHSKLKIQRMELELISLTELCCDIIEDLSRSKEYFPLYSDIPKRDIKCFAAKKQLRECILNLLRNAQEAIHPQDGEIWFKLDQEKNWAVITIIDNGCGISKLEQERIFHPFYSTKTSSKNWGIGLSVCSQIIEAHGGKLMVDSVMGMGSTFRILLSTIY
jgi:signal transduction histidine kinase